jgi:hypothetical protein
LALFFGSLGPPSTGASETTRHFGTCDVTVEVCYFTQEKLNVKVVRPSAASFELAQTKT